MEIYDILVYCDIQSKNVAKCNKEKKKEQTKKEKREKEES